MIGGGIIFIDDKARGLHEGYLVTPIRETRIDHGFILAGAAKAMVAGFVMVTVGAVIAGIPDPLNVLRLVQLLVLVALTALALISMMFLLMCAGERPLVPRATMGVAEHAAIFFRAARCTRPTLSPGG